MTLASSFVAPPPLNAPGPETHNAPRSLTPKQVLAVDRLIEATFEELRQNGPDGFSVRGAAKRAGVAPATAYTWFSSKEHLLAEAMWQKIRTLPDHDQSVSENGTVELHDTPNLASQPRRVIEELERLSTFLAEVPEFSAACTAALLSSSVDVRHLRVKIGQEIHRRLMSALGPRSDQKTVRALELAYSGAMLHVGMGHLTFSELPSQLTEVAILVLGHRGD